MERDRKMKNINYKKYNFNLLMAALLLSASTPIFASNIDVQKDTYKIPKINEAKEKEKKIIDDMLTISNELDLEIIENQENHSILKSKKSRNRLLFIDEEKDEKKNIRTQNFFKNVEGFIEKTESINSYKINPNLFFEQFYQEHKEDIILEREYKKRSKEFIYTNPNFEINKPRYLAVLADRKTINFLNSVKIESLEAVKYSKDVVINKNITNSQYQMINLSHLIEPEKDAIKLIRKGNHEYHMTLTGDQNTLNNITKYEFDQLTNIIPKIRFKPHEVEVLLKFLGVVIEPDPKCLSKLSEDESKILKKFMADKPHISLMKIFTTDRAEEFQKLCNHQINVFYKTSLDNFKLKVEERLLDMIDNYKPYKTVSKFFPQEPWEIVLKGFKKHYKEKYSLDYSIKKISETTLDRFSTKLCNLYLSQSRINTNITKKSEINSILNSTNFKAINIEDLGYKFKLQPTGTDPKFDKVISLFNTLNDILSKTHFDISFSKEFIISFKI